MLIRNIIEGNSIISKDMDDVITRVGRGTLMEEPYEDTGTQY